MGFLWLFLLLGSPTLVNSSCPSPCRCSSTITDCMTTDLDDHNIPTSFPPLTTTLYLNSNYLTSIPNGLFDNLKHLQVVYLQGNDWDCDCDILYLRAWLQWQQNRTLYRDVVCRTPPQLQGRIISYLSEDEIISTCQYWYCSIALLTQLLLFIFILVQAILLLLVILYLRKFRQLAKEAKQTAMEIHENEYQ